MTFPSQNTPSLASMLQKLAPQIGAEVHLHPEWPMVGRITFKNGRVTYFRQNVFDLNSLGAASIAKDKDFAAYFLQQRGYPVVPNSKAFYSLQHQQAHGIEGRGINQAYEYAQHIGLPVVIKPNDGSQGVGVAIVSNEQEFYQAMESIFANYPIAIVQSLVAGRDYRVVVLDGQVMAAYHRVPLNVIGDGQSTIEELFHHKMLQLELVGRKANVDLMSQRLINKLANQGYKSNSIPALGQQVFLLDNANLSSGGDAVDVTDRIHPQFAHLCSSMAKDMGLRYCGVDLMIDGDISQPPVKWWVIEINGSPGMSHYARLGSAQLAKVEGIYRKILAQLEQGQPLIKATPEASPTLTSSLSAETVNW